MLKSNIIQAGLWLFWSNLYMMTTMCTILSLSLSLFLSLLWATFSEANSRNFISLHDSFCTYSTEPSGGNAVNLFSNISPRAKLIQILYGDIGIKQKRTLHEWVGRIANYVELQ